MPERLISIPLDAFDAVAQGPEAGFGADQDRRRRRPVRARWLDADDKPVGPSVRIRRPRAARLEFPRGDGSFGHADTISNPVIETEMPATAAKLRLASGAFAETIPLAAFGAVRSALGPPQERRFGPAGAPVLFTIVSERFDDQAIFHDHVRRFSDWLALQPPFNVAPLSSRIGVRALFWRSDTIRGLFDTGDEKADANEQLFHGDRALAAQLLRPHADLDKLVLILINSPKRGGAGGSPGNAAWASITGRTEDDWKGVALHELGHALGLADEYFDPTKPNTAAPSKLEKNIARRPRAGDAPWKPLITVAKTASPSHALAQQNDAISPNVIGTFQGARYSTALFRPAQTCLMRSTTAQFCAVCQALIRNRL